MAASQQGPPLGARLNTCPQTPGPSDTYWEGAFLQGDEPLAVRQPEPPNEKLLGGLQRPSPAPMVEMGPSTEVGKPLGFS